MTFKHNLNNAVYFSKHPHINFYYQQKLTLTIAATTNRNLRSPLLKLNSGSTNVNKQERSTLGHSIEHVIVIRMECHYVLFYEGGVPPQREKCSDNSQQQEKF